MEQHVQTNIVFNNRKHFNENCKSVGLNPSDYEREFFYPSLGWGKIFNISGNNVDVVLARQPYQIFSFEAKDVIDNLK